MAYAKLAGKLIKPAFKHGIRLIRKRSVQQGVIKPSKFVPRVQKPVSRMLEAGDDIAKGLDTDLYKAINPKYQYIKPGQVAKDKNLLKRLSAREGALSSQENYVRQLTKTRDAASKIPLKIRGRELKRAEKNLKTNTRVFRDDAAENLFVDQKQIYGASSLRTSLKEKLAQFFKGDQEWHHIFGNKEGGELFLQKATQDPMVALNLMKHLEKLDIASSGVRKNLSLMIKKPHNKMHNVFRKLGMEQGGDLDLSDYMKEISENVLKGKADINEFFTMLEVYAQRVKPFMSKEIQKAGGRSMSDIPMKEFIDAYKKRPKF